MTDYDEQEPTLKGKVVTGIFLFLALGGTITGAVLNGLYDRKNQTPLVYYADINGDGITDKVYLGGLENKSYLRKNN